MILAILSYPKNYHITQVAIRHAIKYIPNITEVAIIWDDSHPEKPLAPLNQVMRLPIPCYSYSWSALPNIEYDGNNWAGQQLIKLHMDLLIPSEDFIIFDGDLILNQPIDPANILYSSNIPQTHGRYDHVAELLGLGVYEFSTCPMMYVKAQWLRNIRKLCETNCHTTIDKKLLSAFNKAQSVNQTNWLTEWNVIARYQLQVLKLPRKIEYFHRHWIKGPVLHQFYNNEENFVINGPDDIDLSFYRKELVSIDRKLLADLNYKNR